jgi:hypothetical protein
MEKTYSMKQTPSKEERTQSRNFLAFMEPEGSLVFTRGPPSLTSPYCKYLHFTNCTLHLFRVFFSARILWVENQYVCGKWNVICIQVHTTQGVGYRSVHSQWSALSTGKDTILYHWIRGWLDGPQSWSRHSGKEKIRPWCESNPGHPVHSQ